MCSLVQVAEKKNKKLSIRVSVSYLEIYNETFTDLLNPGGVRNHFSTVSPKVLSNSPDGNSLTECL